MYSKTYGSQQGCSLIFGFYKTMHGLFGVIIITGIYASGIDFYETPIT